MPARAASELRMAGRAEPRELNSAALLRAGVHPVQTNLTGAGVVVCVIDYGFDLLHPTLRTASGETRFAALIDQNGGRLERAEINRLLRDCARAGNRAALDTLYDPHANYFGTSGVEVGAHGSWVASIAAGSRTPAFSGVAPQAPLIGVQLDLPDSAWREVDADGRPTWLDAAARGGAIVAGWTGWRSYEDNRAIAAALTRSYAFARSLRPDGIVFNLSIGAWAGGHDNGSRVNRTIAAILAEGQRPGEPTTVVVAGTGNAGVDEGHVAGHMTLTQPLRFVWSFAPSRAAQSKLEIWAECADDITVEIRSRTANGNVSCALDGAARGTSAIVTADGRLVGIAENRGAVRSGLRAVRIILHPSLPSPSLLTSKGCDFDVRVGPADAGHAGRVHCWIERNDSAQPAAKLFNVRCENTSKLHKVTSSVVRTLCESSITSIACAPSIVSVAGLDHTATDAVVLAMSGRGPRPWHVAGDAPAPLLAAPAHRLFGARSKTHGYMRGSGTSAAAAMVSGASALALQAADRTGRRLHHAELVSALLGRVNSLSDNNNWRPDIGFGALRFDASVGLSGKLHACTSAVLRKEKSSDERTLPPPV